MAKAVKKKQSKPSDPGRGAGLRTFSDAKKFMASVGIALRYWPTPGLPIISMYEAASISNKRVENLRNGITLVNQLLGFHEVVEVNVVAGRLSLVHKTLVPALYRLVTRGQSYHDVSSLSFNGRRVYDLIKEKGSITVGDVRKLFRMPGEGKKDPVYEALSELQYRFLIDRGPFKMPKAGIPYLSKEGYPNHFFHEVRMDMITESEGLTIPEAADIFILRYLNGIHSCGLKKMSSMFKLFLRTNEIAESLDRLMKRKKIHVEKNGRDTIAGIK